MYAIAQVKFSSFKNLLNRGAWTDHFVELLKSSNKFYLTGVGQSILKTVHMSFLQHVILHNVQYNTEIWCSCERAAKLIAWPGKEESADSNLKTKGYYNDDDDDDEEYDDEESGFNPGNDEARYDPDDGNNDEEGADEDCSNPFDLPSVSG